MLEVGQTDRGRREGGKEGGREGGREREAGIRLWNQLPHCKWIYNYIIHDKPQLP